MKRLLLAAFVVPASLALAAEEKAGAPSGDPMAGWKPPKVKNEAKDRQEIQALLKAMDAAGKKGDVDAAAALFDFPVLMITDDSKGEAMGEAWDRERWIGVMKPFYEKPMSDMKITHKPTIFLLTDSLASVDDVTTMTTGGKSTTARNSMFVIRREGKWLVKSMAEGGWGDMMAAHHEQGAAGGSQGAGAGSQGSGSQPSGSATGSQGQTGTGTGTQTDPQRTTK